MTEEFFTDRGFRCTLRWNPAITPCVRPNSTGNGTRPSTNSAIALRNTWSETEVGYLDGGDVAGVDGRACEDNDFTAQVLHFFFRHGLSNY